MYAVAHVFDVFVLMIPRPTISTRTDTLFPYTTLFRSEVQRSPHHGGLAADRVAVDVERVRPVLDVLVAGEEHRIEHRRGHLGDTTAVVLLQDPVGDDVALDEPVRGSPLPDDVVEREGLEIGRAHV